MLKGGFFAILFVASVRGSDMKEYRIFIFNMGHINASHVVSADDDVAAVIAAQAYFDGHGLEVWDGKRFVA